MEIVASRSALARRSATNSAVFMADNFSATATTTNWLMLVLSLRLTSATAFFKETGSRSGQVLTRVFIGIYELLYKKGPCTV